MKAHGDAASPPPHPVAEEVVMSHAEIVAATRSLINSETSRLGILLWFLIHADAAMSSLKTASIRVNPDGLVPFYRYEQTEFGHEVGRDEIDWWINRKETDLAEFSKRFCHQSLRTVANSMSPLLRTCTRSGKCFIT